jgi:hypothetical protein
VSREQFDHLNSEGFDGNERFGRGVFLAPLVRFIV